MIRLMAMSLFFPVLFDLMIASTVTRNITLKIWPYLGQNFAIPKVPIRLQDC